ncbi:MAG: hypothetical protein GEU86_15995 [Actinophytocola sp.]|nr:hypothetical protein [Actinophytocola sp.]
MTRPAPGIECPAVHSPDAETPADIVDVPDAPGLWRLLVTDTWSRETAPTIAIEVFRRLHDAGQPDPYDSALLLCTDWRWQRTSARVLAGIIDTGILDQTDLDRLAEEWLCSDKVTYRHPLGWIGSTFTEFDLGPPGSRRAPRPRTVHLDPNTPATAERHIWPPLRKWAAQHLLTRNRATPADVLGRARALPAHDGAAVVTGAVHAADQLHPEQARTVVDAALSWGHKAPRKAALEHLTARGEHDRVLAIAANDSDASIRAWGRKQSTDAIQSSLFD